MSAESPKEMPAHLPDVYLGDGVYGHHCCTTEAYPKLAAPAVDKTQARSVGRSLIHYAIGAALIFGTVWYFGDGQAALIFVVGCAWTASHISTIAQVFAAWEISHSDYAKTTARAARLEATLRTVREPMRALCLKCPDAALGFAGMTVLGRVAIMLDGGECVACRCHAPLSKTGHCPDCRAD